MRGILLPGNRQVTVGDFPDPKPGPGEVVVRMRVAAVCGSDLHGYRARPEARGELAKVIPGHEPSGDVVEIGPEVHNVRVGDRVSLYHYMGCGRCKHCLAGNINWCSERKGLGWHVHGPDADYQLINEINCLKLPPELNYIDGAFIACQAGTAFNAMRKLGPSGRDTLAIFGLGPVGLCGLMFARAMGARVIGVDVTDERLELASKFGADEVIQGAKEDVVARLKELTDGEGPNLAFETAGVAVTHQNTVESLCRGGKGVFVGYGAQGNTVNLTGIVGNQLTLMGSSVSPIDMYWELASFLVRHKIPLSAMVTHRFGIEEAPEAFRLADTARTGKVIFEWS